MCTVRVSVADVPSRSASARSVLASSSRSRTGATWFRLGSETPRFVDKAGAESAGVNANANDNTYGVEAVAA